MTQSNNPMCQKKQKRRKSDDEYSKPRHVNAKPYKREKSKINYNVDDDYNY